jgi:hypothetical protein
VFLGGPRSLAGAADVDPIGIDRALRDLLGEGSGVCLEIGCGTGVVARVREMVHTDMAGERVVSGTQRR